MVQLQLVVVCPFLQASIGRKIVILAKENEQIARGTLNLAMLQLQEHRKPAKNVWNQIFVVSNFTLPATIIMEVNVNDFPGGPSV